MDTIVSDIGIVNQAFTNMGVERILDFTDETEQARAANAVYPLIRDELLLCHPWGFALKRAELALLSGVPLFTYGKKFQIPTDCLRIISSSVDGSAWVRIADTIETNELTIQMLYIARITDPTKYSMCFVNALSSRIEADLCYKLTSNTDLAKAKFSVAAEKLRLAKILDSQENRSNLTLNSDAWLNSRASGQI